MTTMSAVTARPTRAHQKSAPDVNVTPVLVRSSTPKPPKVRKLTAATAMTDRMPVAMSPLYRAPMIDWFWPSFTKKVPAIDVTMQAAPMARG